MEKDQLPSTLSASAGAVVIDELGENDVLLGRGTGPNENLGNIRFRLAVDKEFTQTSTNGTIDSMSKSKVARRVVEAIKSRNGRFFRKLTKEEAKQVVAGRNTATSRDLFVIVSDKLAIDKARQSIRFQLKKQGSRPYKPTRTSVGQEVYNHRNPNTMQNETCSTQINIQNPEQHVLDATEHFPQIINGGLPSWLLRNSIRSPNTTARQNNMLHGIIDPYMASSGGGSISTAVKMFRTNRQAMDSLCQAKALDEIRDLERQRRMNAILLLSTPNPNRLFFPSAIRRGGNNADTTLLERINAMALGALAAAAESVVSINTRPDRTMP